MLHNNYAFDRHCASCHQKADFRIRILQLLATSGSCQRALSPIDQMHSEENWGRNWGLTTRAQNSRRRLFLFRASYWLLQHNNLFIRFPYRLLPYVRQNSAIIKDSIQRLFRNFRSTIPDLDSVRVIRQTFDNLFRNVQHQAEYFRESLRLFWFFIIVGESYISGHFPMRTPIQHFQR